MSLATHGLGSNYLATHGWGWQSEEGPPAPTGSLEFDGIVCRSVVVDGHFSDFVVVVGTVPLSFTSDGVVVPSSLVSDGNVRQRLTAIGTVTGYGG